MSYMELDTKKIDSDINNNNFNIEIFRNLELFLPLWQPRLNIFIHTGLFKVTKFLKSKMLCSY